MGFIRGIAGAVIEKAKHEVKDYLVKLMEEEKEKENLKEDSAETLTEVTAEAKVEKTEPSVQEVEVKEKKEEKEEIFPLIEKDFTKLSYKNKQTDFIIPADHAETLNMLPLEEFACYVKLLIFATEQRKNFGYLGNTLRKKIGLDSVSPERFDELIENLESFGFIDIDQVSDNQKTFILYIPFNEEQMIKVDPPKQGNKQRQKNNKKQNEQRQKESGSNNQKADELPGKRMVGMQDEDLYKSYRTFVSLEIDKAKMRVGRSSFDKIYMEAVKYIDKKYGFKVLSDSEKFKEHLTNYYISAFDIKTFDEWKKTKI